MNETMKFVVFLLSRKPLFWMENVNLKLIDWFEVMQAMQMFRNEEPEEKEETTGLPEREKEIQIRAYGVVRRMLVGSDVVLPEEFPG